VIAAIAGVVLLLVVVGLYFLMRGDSDSTSAARPSQQSGVQPSPPQRPAAAPTQETFTVDVAEGRAEVYRNGNLVGTTPYQFQSKAGEPQVELVLKREGYVDKSVRLSTTETKKTYTYMLEKKY
jgi:hypothetical protein